MADGLCSWRSDKPKQEVINMKAKVNPAAIGTQPTINSMMLVLACFKITFSNLHSSRDP